MPNPFRAVLFDLEGTLVDFQWNLQGAARDAKAELHQLGFDVATWEDNYATLRNNAVLLAPQRGVAKRAVIDRIDAIYDRYDQDAASRWSVLPEVKPVLRRLKNEKHIQLGLVSNIGRRAIENALPRLGLADWFDVIITRNDVELLKPNGAGIRNALEKLGVENFAALFVGDSVTDVLGAKDARVQVAIVQGGESAPTPLIAAAPDYLWQSMKELEAVCSAE
ncbi:MAG: HAD family hydrolase [Chloroflexi bacterium]|nr:HAD family hydrolase [Chloroflexota bacterium]